MDSNNKVRREFCDGDDDFNVMMQNIQAANNLRTYFLREHGYNGSVIKADITILIKKNKTTVPETHDIT